MILFSLFSVTSVSEHAELLHIKAVEVTLTFMQDCRETQEIVLLGLHAVHV